MPFCLNSQTGTYLFGWVKSFKVGVTLKEDSQPSKWLSSYCTLKYRIVKPSVSHRKCYRKVIFSDVEHEKPSATHSVNQTSNSNLRVAQL